MAIISSYPTVTPASGDLIIGTDVSTTPNSTKTFTVSSISALAPQGTVTSVALTMPAAFSVAGSPITSSGTLAVTGAGSNAQFIDGTGALQTVDSIVGYTTYVARVSQTGTNAPTATVISNNTGLTFTWSRTGVGTYQVSPSSSFVINKTWIQMTGGDISTGVTIVTIKNITTGFAAAVNTNLINGAAADEITAAFVEIRIYP